jgi:hypothetical protein
LCYIVGKSIDICHRRCRCCSCQIIQLSETAICYRTFMSSTICCWYFTASLIDCYCSTKICSCKFFCSAKISSCHFFCSCCCITCMHLCLSSTEHIVKFYRIHSFEDKECCESQCHK